MSSSDDVRLATIGFGGMGQGDTRYSTSLPGTKLVAVSDLYDGRLAHAKEVYGPDLFTTRDYREVLARRDVDAVIIATPDHWHSRITIDALNAGKDVYCEKPMVHSLEEGPTVIEAQRKSGRILQIGSQYVSSAVYERAKELLDQKAIGQLTMVEAWLDRNSAVGAWQYTIPPDASPQTVDWDRFLGSAPKRPFDATRFFRWRNYQDYGTGVAGDLFVHLLSGLHFATGSVGPMRVFTVGGLRYWRDGRDVPDVMLTTMDYPATSQHPEFTLFLRVNFKSSIRGESFGVKFVGSEGVMTAGYTTLTISKRPPGSEPDYSIDAFPAAMQEQLRRQYRARVPERPEEPKHEEVWTPPKDRSAHLDHHKNFLRAVRTRKPFVEDGVFGFRAAGPALLANTSYFERRVCDWDPAQMRAVTPGTA